MIELGRITSKGQITIPKEIREALGVSGGDKILFERKGNHIIVKKAQQDSLVSVLDRAKPLRKETLRAVKDIRYEWD